MLGSHLVDDDQIRPAGPTRLTQRNEFEVDIYVRDDLQVGRQLPQLNDQFRHSDHMIWRRTR